MLVTIQSHVKSMLSDIASLEQLLLSSLLTKLASFFSKHPSYSVFRNPALQLVIIWGSPSHVRVLLFSEELDEHLFLGVLLNCDALNK
jgi:hypothetical protein